MNKIYKILDRLEMHAERMIEYKEKSVEPGIDRTTIKLGPHIDMINLISAFRILLDANEMYCDENHWLRAKVENRWDLTRWLDKDGDVNGYKKAKEAKKEVMKIFGLEE